MFCNLFSCFCLKPEVKTPSYTPLVLLTSVNEESTQTDVIDTPTQTVSNKPPTTEVSTQTIESCFRVVDRESIVEFPKKHIKLTLDDNDTIYARDLLHKYNSSHENKIHFKDIRNCFKEDRELGVFAGVTIRKMSIGYLFKGVKWRR